MSHKHFAKLVNPIIINKETPAVATMVIVVINEISEVRGEYGVGCDFLVFKLVNTGSLEPPLNKGFTEPMGQNMFAGQVTQEDCPVSF